MVFWVLAAVAAEHAVSSIASAMKAMVASVEIVGMHRWSWVLLLLLTVKVFVESVTCVVKSGPHET